MAFEDNKETGGIKRELLTHGICATNTNGVSMQPLFKTHRDVVILKKAEGELSKYDVVLYPGKDGNYILHRIIGKTDSEYIIRGDNTFSKEYVSKGDVIGVLISFNRKGKRHTVDEFGYKFYSRFWNFIYPLRHLSLRIRGALGRLYRNIKRGVHK